MDVEIAVVSVTDSMFGDEKEMSDYAIKAAEKWGLGSKGGNSGIIIAVSRKLKKVSIATGPGLDRNLPPATCQKIMDEQMAPELRQGKYFQGVLNALLAIKDHLGFSGK